MCGRDGYGYYIKGLLIKLSYNRQSPPVLSLSFALCICPAHTHTHTRCIGALWSPCTYAHVQNIHEILLTDLGARITSPSVTPTPWRDPAPRSDLRTSPLSNSVSPDIPQSPPSPSHVVFTIVTADIRRSPYTICISSSVLGSVVAPCTS